LIEERFLTDCVEHPAGFEERVQIERRFNLEVDQLLDRLFSLFGALHQDRKLRFKPLNLERFPDADPGDDGGGDRGLFDEALKLAGGFGERLRHVAFELLEVLPHPRQPLFHAANVKLRGSAQSYL
jgi:hypothetical protein